MTPDQITPPIVTEDGGFGLDIKPTIDAVCAIYVHDDATAMRWALFRQLRESIAAVLRKERGIFTQGRETCGDGYVLDCEILVTSTGAHREHWYVLFWDYSETMKITVRNGDSQCTIPLRIVDISLDEFDEALASVTRVVVDQLAEELPGATPPLTTVIAEEVAPSTGTTHLIASVDEITNMAYFRVTTKKRLAIHCTGDRSAFRKAQEGDILALNGHIGNVISKNAAH